MRTTLTRHLDRPRNRPTIRAAAALTALLLAAPLLTACGSDDASTGSNGSGAASASSDAGHNDNDVTFATDMIPHHLQAIEMAELAKDQDLDPEVQAIADGILTTQKSEIDTMAGWLKSWGQPVPSTDDGGTGMGDGMGDMHSDDSEEGSGDMPGMMSGHDMARLGRAHGRDFQDMWLTMMIVHHRGAIEMARTEISDGRSPDAITMAKDIATAQAAEIEKMRALLDD